MKIWFICLMRHFDLSPLFPVCGPSNSAQYFRFLFCKIASHFEVFLRSLWLKGMPIATVSHVIIGPKTPLFREYFSCLFLIKKTWFWKFFLKISFVFNGEFYCHVECESENLESFGFRFKWSCLALTKTDNTPF